MERIISFGLAAVLVLVIHGLLGGKTGHVGKDVHPAGSGDRIIGYVKQRYPADQGLDGIVCHSCFEGTIRLGPMMVDSTATDEFVLICESVSWSYIALCRRSVDDDQRLRTDIRRKIRSRNRGATMFINHSSLPGRVCTVLSLLLLTQRRIHSAVCSRVR